MTGLKIEGDCADINDKQLAFIKSVIKKRGFKNNKVIIEPLGKAGDNYMANVKRIVVEDENGGSFKMVVKIAPQHELQRQFAHTKLVFRNEHIMYTKILPKYTQLEKLHDVPPQDRLKYPICYGSSDEAPNEVLMLEDLNESNFKILNRLEPLPIDCLKSVIKNIALLHSLGFALKYKEPEIFDEYKTDLFDLFSNLFEVGEMEVVFKEFDNNVVSILESDVHKKAVQGAMMDTVNNFGIYAKSDMDSKHSIIQHGDAWTNNFMFKIDGTSVQSLLIDYQVAKASNPVVDLLFAISACSDYESREKHYYELIDYYHSELDRALLNYGLKSNLIYSKDQLNVDLKKYGKVVFGHTIFMVGMIMLKPEEAVLMKEAMQQADVDSIAKQTSAATSKDPETVAKFKKAVEGLVDSYNAFGLL